MDKKGMPRPPAGGGRPLFAAMAMLPGPDRCLGRTTATSGPIAGSKFRAIRAPGRPGKGRHWRRGSTPGSDHDRARAPQLASGRNQFIVGDRERCPWKAPRKQFPPLVRVPGSTPRHAANSPCIERRPTREEQRRRKLRTTRGSAGKAGIRRHVSHTCRRRSRLTRRAGAGPHAPYRSATAGEKKSSFICRPQQGFRAR